jgi:hypothetical protein
LSNCGRASRPPKHHSTFRTTTPVFEARPAACRNRTHSVPSPRGAQVRPSKRNWTGKAGFVGGSINDRRPGPDCGLTETPMPAFETRAAACRNRTPSVPLPKGLGSGPRNGIGREAVNLSGVKATDPASETASEHALTGIRVVNPSRRRRIGNRWLPIIPLPDRHPPALPHARARAFP